MGEVLILTGCDLKSHECRGEHRNDFAHPERESGDARPGGRAQVLRGDWQLELVDGDDDRLYLGDACAESYVVRLRAAEPRVDLLSFAVSTDVEVEQVAERVACHSEGRLLGPPHERQELGGGYAVRFLDCDGRTVEVSSGVACASFSP
ncbi:hypothetical protein [Nonomuraea sp. NPDC049400]|uniref:hypothetical protein n=1 Tax=Nonomuraea sp. NPDC049400 TaxID=3364352 RepID=UPI00379A0641